MILANDEGSKENKTMKVIFNKIHKEFCLEIHMKYKLCNMHAYMHKYYFLLEV